MRKKHLSLFLIIMLITLIYSGCNELESSTVDTPKKLLFNSDLVDLIDSDLIFNKKGNVIKSVKVKYRFRNRLNEKIDLNVYAEFYDKDGNLLSREGPKEISLSPNYIEKSFGGANSIIYFGEMVKVVDYVRLVVEQKNYVWNKIKLLFFYYRFFMNY